MHKHNEYVDSALAAELPGSLTYTCGYASGELKHAAKSPGAARKSRGIENNASGGRNIDMSV